MKKLFTIYGLLVIVFVLSLFLYSKQQSTCSSHPDTQFQFEIVDDSMIVHNNGTYVGTVKVQGQLDSLLVDYNQ